MEHGLALGGVEPVEHGLRVEHPVRRGGGLAALDVGPGEIGRVRQVVEERGHPSESRRRSRRAAPASACGVQPLAMEVRAAYVFAPMIPSALPSAGFLVW